MIFAVWKEKNKFKVVAPTMPIENAITWADAKDELMIFLKLIPDEAQIIEAEDIDDLMEKVRAGQ